MQLKSQDYIKFGQMISPVEGLEVNLHAKTIQ